MTKKHPPAELPAWITKLTIGPIAEPRPLEKAAWRDKAPAEQRALVWLLLEARHPDRLFFSLGHEKLCERDVAASTSTSCLRPITKARFIALVGDSLTLPWHGGKTALKEVSEAAFGSVHEAVAMGCVRPLRRTTDLPFLSAVGNDFHLVEEVGGHYHQETRTWLDWAPPASTTFSAEEVMARLLSTAFKDDRSRLYALAAFMHVIAEPAVLDINPVFRVTSGTPSDGKTTLAHLAACVGSGRDARTFRGAGATNGSKMQAMEGQWTLAQVLQDGSRFLLFDNVAARSAVGNDLLHGAVTSGRYTMRGVGQTAREYDMRGRQIWMTGINIGADEEMGRRELPIYLKQTDTFPFPDLLDWLPANLSEVRAGLVQLARQWLEAGAPPPPREFRSFRRWGRVVGGLTCFVAKEVLGMDPDPLWLTHETCSPIKEDLDALIEKWPMLGSNYKPLKAGEVASLMWDLGLETLNQELCSSTPGKASPRKVATYLSQRSGEFLVINDAHAGQSRYLPVVPATQEGPERRETP